LLLGRTSQSDGRPRLTVVVAVWAFGVFINRLFCHLGGWAFLLIDYFAVGGYFAVMAFRRF